MTSFNLSYLLKGLASKTGTLGVLGLQGINCGAGWRGCRPNKPTGLCVARKGSGYLLSASVSFGLSSPAAKWPKLLCNDLFSF